jgi:hypothetical protein
VSEANTKVSAFRLRGVGDDVYAADQGRALVWLSHAGEHFEGGGLPRAVWALTDRQSCPRDIQREEIDGSLSAEALREALDGDHGVGCSARVGLVREMAVRYEF